MDVIFQIAGFKEVFIEFKNCEILLLKETADVITFQLKQDSCRLMENFRIDLFTRGMGDKLVSLNNYTFTVTDFRRMSNFVQFTINTTFKNNYAVKKIFLKSEKEYAPLIEKPVLNRFRVRQIKF